MPAISKELETILKKYGEGKDAVWDCHGKWIAYHAALERIARKAGVKFDAPQVLEASGGDKCVALCVTGHMDNSTEWSIGEASPLNYRTSERQAAYPYAMAEKRGKDRVIPKLIGLHGMVYSEEEADDFKEGKPKSNGNGERFGGPLTLTDLKRRLRQMSGEIANCNTMEDLDLIEQGYAEEISQCQRDLPGWYEGTEEHPRGLQATLEEKRESLNVLGAG